MSIQRCDLRKIYVPFVAPTSVAKLRECLLEMVGLLTHLETVSRPVRLKRPDEMFFGTQFMCLRKRVSRGVE